MENKKNLNSERLKRKIAGEKCERIFYEGLALLIVALTTFSIIKLAMLLS